MPAEGGPIFRILFTPEPEPLKDADMARAVAMINDAAGDACVEAGEMIMRRLHSALAKGGTFNVGASGTAANNFTGSLQLNQAGIVEYIIEEGSGYKGNFFIRSGSVGHGNKPPAENIRQWMIDKQIQIKDPEMYGGSGVQKYMLTRTGRISTKYQVRYTKAGRPWKSSQALFDNVLYRIMNSIAQRGTSKASMNRPPYGQPYFDYLKYVADGARPTMEAQITRSAGLLAESVMYFALAGKKARMGDFLGRRRGKGFFMYAMTQNEYPRGGEVPPSHGYEFT